MRSSTRNDFTHFTSVMRHIDRFTNNVKGRSVSQQPSGLFVFSVFAVLDKRYTKSRRILPQNIVKIQLRQKNLRWDARVLVALGTSFFTTLEEKQ